MFQLSGFYFTVAENQNHFQVPLRLVRVPYRRDATLQHQVPLNRIHRCRV